PAGFVVDHPEYVKNLVSCVGCHESVTSGTGEAGQRRCFNCHNEPERIQQFENTTLVHRVHIAERNVECTQCHTPIVHRVVSLAETFQLDCSGCHQRVHDEQRQMYAGMGGHGTEDMPSSMFLARVSCQSCHGIPTTIPGHEQVSRAGEATCMSCHGIRYANILPAWQREIDRVRGEVADVVSAARSTLSAASVRTRATADSLLTLAEANINFVERGKGAHNVAYADELLRASLDLVQQAVELGSLPYNIPDLELGPPVGKNVCLQCHVDISEQAGSFAGISFEHEPHVARAGLACTACHSSIDEHGQTLLTGRATCNACHHAAARPADCTKCHDGPGGAPTQPVVTDIGRFPHQLHREAGLDCALCHEPPAMAVAELPCQGCHLLHHKPDNDCLSCHQGGVLQKHVPIAHNGCTMCHQDRAAWIDGWTRQVCLVCHADKTEHNAPANCALCHRDIPVLGGN
ncbi:MAG TPA: hypothetical protein VLC48_03680, partial [Gemmatimonadota bacterium]|nr:hypothetical protein [Gemmatimonadota bacterium]